MHAQKKNAKGGVATVKPLNPPIPPRRLGQPQLSTNLRFDIAARYCVHFNIHDHGVILQPNDSREVSVSQSLYRATLVDG